MLPFSLLLSLTVTVSNPLNVQREAVPVVVPVGQDGKEINSANYKGHPEITYQLDDLNDDGRADELVFLLDMKPNATETITIDLSSAPKTADFVPGTNAYIKLNDKNKKHPRIQAIPFRGQATLRASTPMPKTRHVSSSRRRVSTPHANNSNRDLEETCFGQGHL